MNSVLQVLFQTLAFRNAVFTGTDGALGDANATKALQVTQSLPLLREMQYTFASMLHTTRNAFAPRNLLAVLPDWVKGGRQHDASELEKAIFDIIDTYWMQQLKGTPNAKTPIQQIFGGQVCSSIRCKSCGNVSERSDTLLDLSLTFPEEAILSNQENMKNEDSNSPLSLNSLIDHYLKPETMHGSNQYRCDRCNSLVDAEKVSRIETAPDHLIINLVRFRYDYKTQVRSKILKVVDFSEQLLLPVRKPRISSEPRFNSSMEIDHGNETYGSNVEVTESENTALNPEELWNSNFDFFDVPYTLYGCIMHSGKSTEYGHYYSYARSSESMPTGELDAKLKPKHSLGSWYRFNDESVDSSSFESFSRISKHIASDVAYILVFKRDEPSLVRSGSSNNIPASIMKRVEDDNAKAEAERRNKNKSIRPTRQALLDTRSRFDDPPSRGGPGGHFGGSDMGFGGGFGGGWIS
jgi:ubiquitin carboxyl-terminal hydrolase 35/38